MSTKNNIQSQPIVKPTLTLRLRPHLREFLICKLQEESIYSSRKNIIGAILEPLLEYQPKDLSPQKSHPDDFVFVLPFKFNQLDTTNHTVYMSEYNQRIFSRILNLYFKDVFFNYIDDKVRYHNEIQKCIFLFCTDYNITFNRITFESLKKSYYRYRLKKKRTNCP